MSPSSGTNTSKSNIVSLLCCEILVLRSVIHFSCRNEKEDREGGQVELEEDDDLPISEDYSATNEENKNKQGNQKKSRVSLTCCMHVSGDLNNLSETFNIEFFKAPLQILQSLTIDKCT